MARLDKELGVNLTAAGIPKVFRNADDFLVFFACADAQAGEMADTVYNIFS